MGVEAGGVGTWSGVLGVLVGSSEASSDRLSSLHKICFYRVSNQFFSNTYTHPEIEQ